MTIDYTKLDQDSVRSELIGLLKQTTTFKDANFAGTVLYDFANFQSYTAAQMGFYLNNIANEPFIDTARQYKNVNRVSNSLLYNPIGKGRLFETRLTFLYCLAVSINGSFAM